MSKRPQIIFFGGSNNGIGPQTDPPKDGSTFDPDAPVIWIYPRPVPPQSEPSLLIVDVEKGMATLIVAGKNPEVFEGLSERACWWLTTLADANGRYVTSDESIDRFEGLLAFKPSRVKAELPKALQNIIDSDSGRGRGCDFDGQLILDQDGIN